MNTVSIRVRAADLNTQMGAMRDGSMTSMRTVEFGYDQYGDTFAVCLDFNKVEEAQDFKKHFSRQDHLRRRTVY